MLPTNEKIVNLAHTGDVFRHAIVGFSIIEAALEELLAHALVSSHKVELSRMTVGLKVDLAIALGLLQVESKGLIMKLSKIRNHYAHEVEQNNEYCDYQEVKSCFSETQRSLAREHFDPINTFAGALRIAFVCAFYEIKGAITRQERIKQQRAAVALDIQALLDVIPENNEYLQTEGVQRAKELLESKIEKRKAELREGLVRETD
jgi:hypothetical protein